MKKTFKKIGMGIGVIIALLIAFLLGVTIFHRINLRIERDQLVPIGYMVEVNGRQMHVYIAGDNIEAPLLVFLSGHGTFAPAYDFRPLYSLLTDDYRIAVIEKFGYGYSDFTDAPRDVDTIVSEMRAALFELGETGSFVLLPASMGGIEALRWAQLYPEEVIGIIGIDMAHPAVYLGGHIDGRVFEAQIFRMLSWMGLQRFSFIRTQIYPYGQLLTPDEYDRARLLLYRNAMNRTAFAETRYAITNAQMVMDNGIPHLPILLLTSREFAYEIGAFWIPYQEEFARATDAQIEFFDSGHFLHQYEPERIANLIRAFLMDFNQ
ncbi:MAG: alpha/beta hydrolase [Defluviitaleaceae bacterium]|nr:alpha/beta hydrolase [Defluviitaleaceae bacterium]MCL2247589.1 alpha/beta hydrolase [Lentimicrobiaceae bacterium]